MGYKKVNFATACVCAVNMIDVGRLLFLLYCFWRLFVLWGYIHLLFAMPAMFFLQPRQVLEKVLGRCMAIGPGWPFGATMKSTFAKLSVPLPKITFFEGFVAVGSSLILPVVFKPSNYRHRCMRISLH